MSTENTRSGLYKHTNWFYKIVIQYYNKVQRQKHNLQMWRTEETNIYKQGYYVANITVSV